MAHWIVDSTPTYGRQLVDYFDVAQSDLRFAEIETSHYTASNASELSYPIAVAADMNADGTDELISLVGVRNSGYIIRSERLQDGSLIQAYPDKETLDTGDISIVPILLAGEIDDRPGDELMFLYVNSGSDSFKIEIYSLTESNITLLVMDQRPVQDAIFNATLADLDLNGLKEISLVYALNDSAIVETIAWYNSALTSLQRTAILSGNLFTFRYYENVAICSGDFNADIAQELGVAIVGNANSSNEEFYSYIIQPNDIIDDTFNIFESIQILNQQTLSDRYFGAFELLAGDMNGDGKDALMVYPYITYIGIPRLYMLEVDNSDFENAEFRVITEDPFIDRFEVLCDDLFEFADHNNLLSADLNSDGREELIFITADPCKGFNGRIQYSIYEHNEGSDQLINVNTKSIDVQLPEFGFENYIEPFSYASFVIGDFDGDNIYLGPGRYFRKTDFRQPLVVLNAPPIHFDIIDGQNYDINQCYNNNECEFTSVYITTMEGTEFAETEVRADWGISATVSGELSGAAGSVKASVTAKYGEKFTQYAAKSTTIKIESEVRASEDDRIYASIVDYDIWEYPVYQRDTLIAHLMSVSPRAKSNAWILSKSYSALDYIPDHEVGNILSYRTYAQDRNPVEDDVRFDFVGDVYPLDENSFANWSVDFSQFSENGTSTQKDIGLEASASASVGKKFAGIGAKLEVSATGTYDKSELSTHSTTVKEDIQIRVELRDIDESIGEVIYSVTPYCYWAKNGTIVIDYAAKPEVPPSPGAPDTWWSEKYGTKVDPALILPWKYDPEKGSTLQQPNIKRYESKSISFAPSNPEIGDTVTIITDVHNWSLLPTEGVVSVGFYVCDPENEGNRLIDINGNNSAHTDAVLLAQDRQVVTFDWVVPESLPNNARIYARIDPDNTMCEIHKNNNIGYNLIPVFTSNATCGDPAVPAFNNTICGYPDCTPTITLTPAHLEYSEHQDVFKAMNILTASGIVTDFNGENLLFNAGQQIELQAGFEVEMGASLTSNIETCQNEE